VGGQKAEKAKPIEVKEVEKWEVENLK